MKTVEGIIKFSGHLERNADHISQEIAPNILNSLCGLRDFLKSHDLMGVDKEGVGYGNLSMRIRKGKLPFVVTTSQTSHISPSNAECFCSVEKVNFENFELWCTGASMASSESMTHATFYALEEACLVVAHFHHAPIWNYLKSMNQVLPYNEYGTREMVEGVKETLFDNPHHQLAMLGHEDGVILWSDNMESIKKWVVELLLKSQ